MDTSKYVDRKSTKRALRNPVVMEKLASFEPVRRSLEAKLSERNVNIENMTKLLIAYKVPEEKILEAGGPLAKQMLVEIAKKAS